MRGEEQRFGETVLRFDDPSGLWFELAGTTADPRAPWTGNGVAADAAIRGLHSVTMLVRSLPPSLALLTGVLGYAVVDESGERTRVAVGGHGPGHVIDIVVDPEAPRAVNGLGTVHHVAMAIATGEEQLALRQELLDRGVAVTEVRDRCYFQSIYFREPGGVLFEVATMQPGFTVDEDVASLGRDLKLPPWEEPYRATIEANLAAGGVPLMDPHAGQPVLTAGAPLGTAPVAVIMVHGRNAGPANILDLVPRLERPQVSYLAPAAAGRTWYPHSFLADIASNEPWLSSALAGLATLVGRATAAGVPRQRVVLLGFSQGACLAAEFAVRHAARYGGIVAFSGGVVGPPGTTWDASGDLAGTPAFFGCSDRDSHVPEFRVTESAELYARMGAAVTTRIYPGLGHQINDDEIAWAQALLDSLAG